MGYQKIVQFGNVTEIYSYDKEIKPRPPSRLKARLLTEKLAGRVHKTVPTRNNVKKNRKDAIRKHAKEFGTYTRSEASIKRSRINFFRLCHHNNTSAQSIHFVTLTFAYDLSYKTACRHVARFMERVSTAQPEIPVSYISVPELTEKNRYHFHLLIYNLSTRLAGEPIKTKSKNSAKITTERTTRNLQRLFQRGYLDIMPATYTSRGIAGYMAKYMAKALGDTRYESTRGYNTSRNIKKISSHGGNTLSIYSHELIPTDNIDNYQQSEYDVPYLGVCKYTRIETIK